MARHAAEAETGPNKAGGNRMNWKFQVEDRVEFGEGFGHRVGTVKKQVRNDADSIVPWYKVIVDHGQEKLYMTLADDEYFVAESELKAVTEYCDVFGAIQRRFGFSSSSDAMNDFDRDEEQTGKE